jgi:hypothetical protein
MGAVLHLSELVAHLMQLTQLGPMQIKTLLL